MWPWHQDADDAGPDPTPRRPARPAAHRRWHSHAAHEPIGPHLAARRHYAASGQGWSPDSEPHRMTDTSLVQLDGSHGEGGGQILRTALTLSLLTGRPFRIRNIRANRSQPGLRPQHLMAVESAARLGNARVEGARLSARTLEFHPGEYQPTDLVLDVGTAGSAPLVLQTLYLAMALRAESGVRVTIQGGTFNPKAPSAVFLHHTYRRWLGTMGLSLGLSHPVEGFYPRGGGRLEAWIEPGQPRALTCIDRGELVRLTATAGVANLTESIARRMRDQAVSSLESASLTADIQTTTWTSPGQGAAFVLIAEYENVTSTFVGIGERGKPAEVVADEAVDEFLAYHQSEGAVDAHSADQILLPLALAEGRSVYTVAEPTEHLRTNIATIAAFLDRPIRLEEPDDAPARVIIG